MSGTQVGVLSNTKIAKYDYLCVNDWYHLAVADVTLYFYHDINQMKKTHNQAIIPSQNWVNESNRKE